MWLSDSERTAIRNRLDQIEDEITFPGLRGGQRYALAYERVSLFRKLGEGLPSRGISGDGRPPRL
jgi:hypothetical protein